MPTVLRHQGCRIVIYPNDHRPPHVHVLGRGCEAVFLLNCPSGPPMLREVYGFSQQDCAEFIGYIAAHLTQACKAWSDWHDA